MTADQDFLQAPRAQGIYSRTYIEQWLDSLPPKSFTARTRREFLASSTKLELGELSYHLESVGENQYKVHCVNTEEFKKLFSILDEASDKAGFGPRWIASVLMGLAYSALGVAVMGLLIALVAPNNNDLPSWASLLQPIAGIVGAVYGYIKGRKIYDRF